MTKAAPEYDGNNAEELVFKGKKVDEKPKNVQEKSSSSEYTMKERIDFTQTVLFKEFIKVSNGQLKGSFNLSELITKFRF